MSVAFRIRQNHELAGYVYLHDDFTGGLESASANGNIGETGWRADPSDLANWVASESNHPGIIRLSTDPTTNDFTCISRFANGTGQAANEGLHLPSQVQGFSWVARLNQITSVRAFLGLTVEPLEPDQSQVDSVGVAFDSASDTNWMLQTRSASPTRVSTGVPVVAGNWYHFDLWQPVPGRWAVAVNGIGNTVSSTNIPTSLLQPYAGCTTLANAVKSLDVDYWDLTAGFLRRYT